MWCLNFVHLENSFQCQRIRSLYLPFYESTFDFVWSLCYKYSYGFNKYTYNINKTIFILENEFSRCIKKARVNHSGIILKR